MFDITNSLLRSCFAAVLGSYSLAVLAPAATPEIPNVQVRYAHLPYFDHSQAIIGLKQGWFKEVGITYVPNDTGITVTAEDAPARVCIRAIGRYVVSNWADDACS